MDDSSLRALFQKISSDDTLRRSLLEALQPTLEETTEDPGRTIEAGGDTSASNVPQPDGRDRPEDTSLVAYVHQTGRDASLVADARQSRGIGEQGADEPLSTSNPPGSRSDNSGSSSSHPPTFNPVLFDPSSVTSESEYTFDTHQIITDYLEKHFRVSLTKEVRNPMHKTHPVPHTPVMKVPKIDRFMLDHLKQNYPKLRDAELGTIQSALLSATGPLTCLWADIIDSELHTNEEGVVNVHDVLDIMQRTLVLLGNANELISQSRHSNILRCVDGSLEKYASEPRPNSGGFLFGEGFCAQLKGKVESDTTLAQVASLSKRYHPYGERPRDSRRSTLGRSKQFFRKSPAGGVGHRQGQSSKFQHRRGSGTYHRSQAPPTFNNSAKSGKP